MQHDLTSYKKALEQGQHVERIDADAVCAKCGTVNPEDTFLCRKCGNNLRDQRAQRVSAEGADGFDLDDAGGGTSWASKGLVVFGLLLIIWTSVNVVNGNIQEWMLSTQLAGNSAAVAFWSGFDSDLYDDLAVGLEQDIVTPEVLQAAKSNPGPYNSYSGTYVLVKTEVFFGSPVLGVARVREEGENLHFVALLKAGSTEIRGVAQYEESIIASRQTAALKSGDEACTAWGMAGISDDGVLECFAQTEVHDRPFSCFMYKIPEQEVVE